MADPPPTAPPPDAQPPAADKAPAAPLTPEAEDAPEEQEAAESEVDEEYVSDPDDALPEMRRREASDDEGSEDPPRARIDPDHDHDGQGAPEDYEGEVEDDDEYYDDLLEEEEAAEGLEEEEEYDGRAVPPKEVAAGQGEEGDKAVVEGEEAEGEEKKEQEPFAVPTSGAFYMHDDRFAENGRGGGGRRRMLGGRKLWDAKDDQAWVHDRFEEMNVHDRFDERYEDKRGSRGRFRGRGSGGRTRGTARGSSRGGRYRSYHEDSENQNLGDSQNRPQRVVRGRGPRRYDAIAKNTREVVGYQRKQPARSREPAAHSALDREAGQISNAHSDAVPAKKNVVNSSLNSASPPFYPSGASNHAGAQRRDMQAGGSNNMKLQSGPIVRGRGTTDYGGRDRFHAEGHVRPSPSRTAGASSNSSGFSASSVNAGQSPTARAQGGNSSIGVSSHNQPTSSFHQTSRTSAQQQNHTSVMHQKSGQVPTQPATRIPTQQLSHRNNPSPTAQHLPARSTESGENGSYPSSNQSKTISSEVEKTNKEMGRGSFMYGGAQIIGSAGAAGLAQGDQNNFPGTPALLPVMQFAGQHPGGLGVGMALPGYVAQQQLGMGNNEMAWLPLLAGAAGAFGGSYPPYITLDPSFYSRSSGQTSSSIPSREASVNKGAKSPPENDIVTEELDQRQNKPRRYSEMNFSQ
ncbi:hypothetical protein QYE76_053580 [Lolium multiflorum]|uniref:Btz domain-containing protein n=1 Tax=Lolium multiflorum TaxID=4521 RepID=A0AAD8SXI7_LOLMU|nr:hypothetical protein QYE76_053580 [Lolium multiflorum]